MEETTPCLAAFEMTERAVPRQGCPIVRDGETIGEVTSGLFSPTLKKGVGLAYIEARCAKPGTPISVQIRHKQFAAQVAERPLYRRG
jgi:aminomethyltransferase